MSISARSAFFVVGMHRSGTSAVSGALHFLEMSHGSKLMAPAPDNPKGFWENRYVVNLNDRMLDSVGASWDKIPSFVGTDGIEAVDPARYFRDRFSERVSQVWKSQFEHSVGSIVLKDPRTCFTLPVWEEIAARDNRQVRHLFAVRKVEDVGRSLARRNGFTPEHSVMLWAHYNLAALRHLPEGAPVIWHDDFLAGPSKILMEAGLKIDEAQAAKIDEFVDNESAAPVINHTTEFQSAVLRELIDLVNTVIGTDGALGPICQRNQRIADGFSLLHKIDQSNENVFQLGAPLRCNIGTGIQERLVAEYCNSFSSFEDWEKGKPDLATSTQVRNAVLNSVKEHGFVEPVTGIHRPARHVTINEKNLRESISSNELNSRKRALILQIWRELQASGLWGRRDLKIFGAEGLSRLALILRGIFPYYIGTEYLPDEESQKRHFPIPHADLQDLPFEDESFDLFVSGDVLEHIPDLDKSLCEILRVLKPGGILVSSFPFSPSRQDRLVKARLNPKTGEVEHLESPEYHGNPTDPEAGALVFSLPGWEIVETVKRMGAQDAYFSLVASARFGIVADHSLGPMVFSAVKGGAPPRQRPRSFRTLPQMPDRVCVLGALPRSGTTLLTSMLSVHSKVTAIYEPWNAKLMSEEDPATLENLINKSKTQDLFGRTLLVKETGKNITFIQNLSELLDSAPFFTEKSSIVLLRQPDQTFLSEVARRNEWWGASIELGLEAFNAWCQKSEIALRKIIALGIKSRGFICLLESLSSRPEHVLSILMEGLNLPFEQQQLEYQEHVDKSNVRGDLNVSKNPAKIDPKLANSRMDQREQVLDFVQQSPYGPWYAAFDDLFHFVEERGGVLELSSLTKSEIAQYIAPLVDSPAS